MKFATALLTAVAIWQPAVQAQVTNRFSGPISSQPLALTADSSFLIVANPDNNSVSFFDVRADRNRRLATVPVGTEPNGVTFSANGRTAYIANTVSGTVSVIPLNLPNGFIGKPSTAIRVGTEPYSLVISPNGAKLYVANARSNDISIIDTATNTVVKTLTGIGFEPRGLAITNDGDGDDLDETLYVTNFLSLPIAGKLDGADDSKAGKVYVVSTSTDTVSTSVTINPIADTGFNATGDALARIPPGAFDNPANFIFPTGAYPNQLNNVAIKGNFAYLPNTGSSPNGPVRFDVNTQSLLAVINRLTNLDAGQTNNMHRAVKAQTNPAKLFITQPWAMAFEHSSQDGWVLSAASNILVKVVADPATGATVVQNDPTDPSRVFQIKVGKNPRGIVINNLDTRAYVMNFISRDVSVIALTGGPEQVVATVSSADLPAPGTDADRIHAGKELYNTSVGEFDPVVPGGPAITGRMSANGWGACSACHPNGLSDNVVWIFPAGPRRTLSQHVDFDPANTQRIPMRVLNWSANRDEQEDFELNIRAVSGGQGLIVLPGTATQDTNVQDFTPLANANRNQLTIRGIPAWDAMKAFIRFGIRPPISPQSKTDPDVISGAALFRSANCQSCHGTAMWTTSRVRFTPPPNQAQIVNGQLIEELRKVGTFDPNLFNEVRQNAAPPLGADGFVPPTLMSIFAFPQTFFHNGIATSLEDVMGNVTHRSSGTGGVDTLTNAADRAKVIKFLLSIDAGTPAIDP